MSERYGGITSAQFGATPLSLPVGARVWRKADPLPLAGDGDAFLTSVQLAPPVVGVEIRLRDSAAAEGLAIGQSGKLTVYIAPTRAGQAARKLELTNAVLTGVELAYEQSSPAVAKLTFLAESSDGQTDPFAAQEVQP
jgi:hypothetical protein